MHKNLTINLGIFAVEILRFLSMIAMTLKFTQMGNQSLIVGKTYKILLKLIS